MSQLLSREIRGHIFLCCLETLIDEPEGLKVVKMLCRGAWDCTPSYVLYEIVAVLRSMFSAFTDFSLTGSTTAAAAIYATSQLRKLWVFFEVAHLERQAFEVYPKVGVNPERYTLRREKENGKFCSQLSLYLSSMDLIHSAEKPEPRAQRPTRPNFLPFSSLAIRRTTILVNIKFNKSPDSDVIVICSPTRFLDDK